MWLVSTLSRVVNEHLKIMLSDNGLQTLQTADADAFNWLEQIW